MKVYISSTPDFEQDKLKDVLDTLNLTDGILEFIQTAPLTSKQLGLVDKSYKTISDDEILSFTQLFDICEWHRTNLDIDDDSFLVMITNMNIADEWFSAFRGKNIFIDGNNWNHFTKKDSKFGIAYQVIENIFQSLINLNIEGVLDELIHQKAIGCINDYCDDKEEITLKLMTAHICPKCMDRANKLITDQSLLIHIKNSLKTIRNVYELEGENFEDNLPSVTISEEGKVLIGNLDLDLQEVHQAIYIFFLSNLQGVEKEKVHENANKIFNIYKKVKKRTALKTPIGNIFGYKINKQINKNNVYFIDRNEQFDRLSTVRSKIKDKIVQKLGESFLKFYNINLVETNTPEIFKIDIPENKINIHSKFNDLAE